MTLIILIVGKICKYKIMYIIYISKKSNKNLFNTEYNLFCIINLIYHIQPNIYIFLLVFLDLAINYQKKMSFEDIK